MNTRPKTLFVVACLMMVASTLMAQSPRRRSTTDSCDFGYQGSSYSDYRSTNDRFRAVQPTSWRDEFGSRIDSARDRLDYETNRLRHGYDYQAPLTDFSDHSFRRPVRNDYPSYENDRRMRAPGENWRLEDPFRLPAADDFHSEERFLFPRDRRDGTVNDRERRYRVPYRPVDYSGQEYDSRRLDGTDFGVPARGRELPENPGRPSRDDWRDRDLDPFTPPVPVRGNDSDSEAIFNAISVRYGNPVNVRSVRSMSASQALALYREVSQQTDERHLEPSSYDLRVRRGLRNVALALENPTFVQAFGLQSDSFRMDGFRSALSRMSDSMQVSSYSDAQRVVQTVMQQAQSIGLSGNVVAFEFASATVDTLDKFSALEPAEPSRGAAVAPDETKSVSLDGEIVGIGVEVKIHEQGLLVNRALRGGPAAEAGLASGDIISAINGRSIRGMSMANSVDLMKGTEGSRIQLRIVRNGSRGSDVSLTRRRVRVYTVNDARIQNGTDGVAYISLSQFGHKSTAELDQALQQMYDRGMKSLVLDLRGNPGGLLNVCVDITNRFLPCGTIVSTKGRLSSDNMVETASYKRTWKTPLVVLIDNDSASASEIFAAAVQDNRRGVIVGERSYGKGTVQTHFPLSTVNGNLRLTTARFYSPNGRPMSGQGVTPDVPVTDADGPANGDRVLAEAIRIAQSQRLKDIADAASKCRSDNNYQPQRNSLKGNIYDSVSPRTVLR